MLSTTAVQNGCLLKFAHSNTAWHMNGAHFERKIRVRFLNYTVQITGAIVHVVAKWAVVMLCYNHFIHQTSSYEWAPWRSGRDQFASERSAATTDTHSESHTPHTTTRTRHQEQKPHKTNKHTVDKQQNVTKILSTDNPKWSKKLQANFVVNGWI